MNKNTGSPPIEELEINEQNQTSVQELAEFLRDVTYSEELFDNTDRHLFAEIPNDTNGDIVYEGVLHTHDRGKKQRHHYLLRFRFTSTRGLFDINAKKDDSNISVDSAMTFEQFKDFVITLFKVETLFEPRPWTGRHKSKPVKDAPALQDVMTFMSNVAKPQSSLKQKVDWTIYVVHPRDNNGDVSYSGGLWTYHDLSDPLPKLYNSLSFSYSKTRGIHEFQAWKNHHSIHQCEKISFEAFKAFTRKHFDIENPQPDKLILKCIEGLSSYAVERQSGFELNQVEGTLKPDIRNRRIRDLIGNLAEFYQLSNHIETDFLLPFDERLAAAHGIPDVTIASQKIQRETIAGLRKYAAALCEQTDDPRQALLQMRDQLEDMIPHLPWRPGPIGLYSFRDWLDQTLPQLTALQPIRFTRILLGPETGPAASCFVSGAATDADSVRSTPLYHDLKSQYPEIRKWPAVCTVYQGGNNSLYLHNATELDLEIMRRAGDDFLNLKGVSWIGGPHEFTLKAPEPPFNKIGVIKNEN